MLRLGVPGSLWSTVPAARNADHRHWPLHVPSVRQCAYIQPARTRFLSGGNSMKAVKPLDAVCSAQFPMYICSPARPLLPGPTIKMHLTVGPLVRVFVCLCHQAILLFPNLCRGSSPRVGPGHTLITSRFCQFGNIIRTRSPTVKSPFPKKPKKIRLSGARRYGFSVSHEALPERIGRLPRGNPQVHYAAQRSPR